MLGEIWSPFLDKLSLNFLVLVKVCRFLDFSRFVTEYSIAVSVEIVELILHHCKALLLLHFFLLFKDFVIAIKKQFYCFCLKLEQGEIDVRLTSFKGCVVKQLQDQESKKRG